MKKKVIFALATGLFVVATVFNMNVLQSNSAGDVSLDAIAVMAQAQNGESNMVPEVTVYGYKEWVEGYDEEGVLRRICAVLTSDTPRESNC
jgi:hypothetical protein